MKGIKVLLSLSIILIFTFDVDAKGPGETGVTFLKIGVGAKPRGMGEAFCAVADDPATIYYNPAGLALLEDRKLSFTHLSLFEKANYEYLTYLNPLQELGIKIPGVLSGSLAYLGIQDIKEYSNTDIYLGKFNAYNLLLNLSYARVLNNILAGGLNLKFINQKIKSSSKGIAMDLGLLYKTPIKNLRSGLNLQNIALVNNFKEDLPFNIKLGSCLKLLKDNALTLAMDIDLPNNDTNFRVYLGAEYQYLKTEDIELVIRGGSKTGVDSGKLTFGFGVKYDKYKFDYAYSSYDDLGNIHQFSFNMRFDKIRPQSSIPSPSAASVSTPNVVFESEEKKVITSLENANKKPATILNEPSDKLEKQIPQTVIKEKEIEEVIEKEKEVVKEEKIEGKKKLITEIPNEEQPVNKGIEEKTDAQKITRTQEIENLEEILNFIKNNYSNAKVTIEEE